ncbi:MAG: ABC-type transporter Mla subunit MlaD [Oceanicoccus sp.]|jgi:ABC-type transporter Mla subunit MlaD
MDMSLLNIDFSPWTLILIGIIVLLTIYFQFFRYSSRTAESAPTILTSIGIFGTFLGVALGLSSFDTTQLQESVPQLLSGLKTAFWSSIAGLLGALTIKFRAVMDATHGEEHHQRTTSIDDLNDSMKAILNALSQDENDTAYQQMALMRVEQQRQSDDLIVAMQHYQEKMVEANTQALIEALGVVMRDFNTKIDEQYGENFKRLNESVGSMLLWQKEYKQQLVELADNQQRIGSSMIQATDAFESMVHHAESFNGISESLGNMLQGLNIQRDVLDKHLTGLATLVSEAGQGLPQLEERITFLTSGLATTLEQYNARMENMLSTTTQSMSATTGKLGEQLQQSYSEAFEKLDHQIMQSLIQSDKKIAKLDAALEHELNKSLKTMGQQLGALSEKFVQDYGPLTDRLHELVKLAEKR